MKTIPATHPKYKGIELTAYPPSVYYPTQSAYRVAWNGRRIATVWRQAVNGWSFALGDSFKRGELWAPATRSDHSDEWIAARRAVDEYQMLRARMKNRVDSQRRRDEAKKRRGGGRPEKGGSTWLQRI
jgi:hypothetical protein